MLHRIKNLSCALFSAALFLNALSAATPVNITLGSQSGYEKLRDAGCGMNFMEIGSPGNAAPDSSRNYDRSWGAVNHAYGMGQTQVTWSQWVVFLNDSGLAGNAAMFGSTNASTLPIYNDNGVIKFRAYQDGASGNAASHVKYEEAVAFANWLSTGDINQSGVFSLPTVDEWYKAAYYDPNHGGQGVGGYWKYGTSTDSVTMGDAYTAGDVFGGYMSIYPNSGAWPGADYGKENIWGLYGMCGGLEDWTCSPQNAQGTRYWAMGGNWGTAETALSDAATNYTIATSIPSKAGFRLVIDMTQIPEASTYALILGGIACVVVPLLRRKSSR